MIPCRPQPCGVPIDTHGMVHSPICSAGLPVGPRLIAARWDSLWSAGDPTSLEPPLVAIVGTREADLLGRSLARRFASVLASEGIVVISGGALGIDASAHAGALEAGGRTAVILPSGLEHLYPVRHGPLYESVVATGGALVSPFPPETPPGRWTFPRRNALLAALCDLLVVVQAPLASGSLITAEAARRLGRRVLVVPASPGDPRGTGCLKLLRLGAEMCATPEDVLAALAQRDGPLQAFANGREPVREHPSPTARRAPRQKSKPTRTDHPDGNICMNIYKEASSSVGSKPPSSGWALDEQSRVVYESLGLEGQHIDEIAYRTGLGAARIRSVLLSLVLMGAVCDLGDGSFIRSG